MSSKSDLGRQRAAETKRERTRGAILRAAREKFEAQGYGPTTVEEIARAASVGLATVYYHYPTKNVIAGHVYRPLVDDLLTTSPALDAADPTDALTALITELTRRAKTHTALTVALLEAVQDSTARRGAQIDEDDPRYWVPLPPVFTTIIERGQSSGDFYDYPPASDAGPMISNWILLRVLTRPAEPADQALRYVLTTTARLLGFTEILDFDATTRSTNTERETDARTRTVAVRGPRRRRNHSKRDIGDARR